MNEVTTTNQSMLAERTLNEEQFKAAKAQALKVTSYIGADTADINDFLNIPFEIVGAVCHQATIGQDGVLDKETGEVKDRTYIEETRTVFKLADGQVIGFVSKAATSFAQQVLFPSFGVGDFSFPVAIKVKQISKGDRRTYNFQIVG